MRGTSFKKFALRALKWIVIALVLAFVVYYVNSEWRQLAAHPLQINFWLLALAFAGFMLQELSYGVIWQSVLARLGYTLDLRTSLRIYLASEFVRYIPGNVWHVLTRILWVGRYGVSRPVAFASMMIELVTKLAAGVLIFAASLLFWGDAGHIGVLLRGKPLIVGLSAFTIIALLIVLHPRVLSGLLNMALRLLKREPIVLSLRYRDILYVTLFWCVSWLIAGSAFYIMILALWPTLPLAALPVCVGIYAIGWDIGFVSFITPSGLGFREGAIAGLLALSVPALPLALGPLLAILSRLISTLAELVCVSIAYLGGGRQARELQRQQESLPVAEKPAMEEQENTLSPIESAETSQQLQAQRSAKEE